MIKVRDWINGNKDIYISLQEMLNKYHQNPPEGWLDYIKSWVNECLDIKDEKDYAKFSEHSYILEHFDYKSVQKLYHSLKRSGYNKMFDDDILRFIAYIYGLGYFERTKFQIDINNPNLDEWLNTKNVFSSYYERSLMKENERYSLMDLLPLKYGMNAIRRELLRHHKW